MGKGIWKALVAIFTGKKPGPRLSAPLPPEPPASAPASRPPADPRLETDLRVRQRAKKRHQNRVKQRAAKEKRLSRLPPEEPEERQKQPIPELDPNRPIASLFGMDETRPPSGGEQPAPKKRSEPDFEESEPDFEELVECYPEPAGPGALEDEVSEAIRISERIKRYPAPQDSLDLHRHTEPQARERCEAFIKASQAKGLLTVTVIVGRGRHSPQGPKLPHAIERTLGRLKREGWVLSFHWEGKRKKGKKRKSGALVVYLPPMR